MKYITIILSVLLFSQISWGHGRCDATEAADETIVGLVDAIATELQTNSHRQKIMNMAYNRSRVARKIANRFLNRTPRLKDAQDADILPLLEDIATSINNLDHRFRRRCKIFRHLRKVLKKLEEHREAPVELAVLSIDGADPLDFGTILIGLSQGAVLNITNEGNGPATVTGEVGLNVPFDFVGGSYPGTTGSCGVVIQAGESCQITLEFSPNLVGTFNDQMILEYQDGLNTQSISKDVMGTAL